MRLTYLIKLFLCFFCCYQMHMFVFAQQKEDVSNKVDSTLSGLKQNVRSQVSRTKENVLNGMSGASINNLEEKIKSFDPGLNKVKLLSGRPRVSVNALNFTAGYSYIHDTSVIAKGMYNDLTGIYNYNIDYGLAFSAIPFKGSINGSNGFYAMTGTRLNDLYNLNFDPNAYKDLLRSEVMKKISPDIVLGSIMKRINNIKDSYKSQLQKELTQIQSEFVSKYGRGLDLPEDATDITVTDVNALRTKLFGNVSVESLKDGEDKRQNLLAYADESRDSSKISEALFESEKLKALQKAYGKIVEAKDKFENNPTVKKLQSHLPFTPENYKAYLSEPGKLADVVKKFGSLSSLQNLFLHLTKLDLGQNPVENGQFSVQHLMNTGVNSAFQNSKIGAGLIAGVNNNPNNWLQGGLNNFVTNEYSSMAGVTLGTGSNSKFNQSLSFNLFNISNPSWAEDPSQYLQSSYIPTAKRRDAVITLHSGIRINEKHEISVDVSKSFGSFQNSIVSGNTEYSKSAIKGILGSEGRSNYAVAIDYRGQIYKTDLQVLLKNAGLGYNNPGNMFIRRGETQFQTAISRRLIRQKLTLKYKTDYRKQHFDPEKRYTYSSFSNKLNGTWKFKRNNRAGLSYQQSNYTSISPLGGEMKGKSAIVQADGTYRFRVLKKNITNTEILAYQKMILPSLVEDVYKSKSIFFAHTTMIPVKRSFVIVSAMLNQSNNDAYYFNTSSMNTEGSYNYMLFDKIQMTSGAGYYVNKGWNRQVGFKQSISFTASRKIIIDCGIDYKKAVKIIRTELANPIFVNTSVSYKL